MNALEQATAEQLAEYNRLMAENARLRAQLASIKIVGDRKPSFYESATHGAYTFKGKSIAKRNQVSQQTWECGCRPYVDILTPGRWRALGYHVRRGESAQLRAGKLGNTPIFCLCQVSSQDDDTPAKRFGTLEEMEEQASAPIPF